MSIRVPTAPEAGLGREQVQPLQGGFLGVQASPADFGAGLGRTVEQAGGALGQIGENLARLDQHRARMRGRVQEVAALGRLTAGLAELEAGFARDPDIGTAPQRFETAAEELLKRATEGLDGDEIKQRVSLEFEQLRSAKRLSLRKSLWEREDREYLAGLDEMGDDLARIAATAGTAAERTAIIRQYEDSVDGLAAVGRLDPVEAGKRKRDFLAKRETLAAQQMVFAAPADAARRLMTDPGFMPGLPPETRQRLIETATSRADSAARQRVAEMDRADRMRDRAERQRRDATAKQADEMLAKGELTPEWLQANRESLDGPDYRHFWTRLTSDRGDRTDPDAYVTLWDSASKGTDVTADVNAAYRRGMLRREDRDRLLERAQKNDPTADVPHWFKRGERFIGEALKVSELNPDPAAAQRKANAVEDWNRWAKSNPKASDGDAEKAYQRIVSDYTFIDTSQMLIAMPKPTHLVGSRNDPTTIDMPATVAATIDAFAGRYGNDLVAMAQDPEFGEQMARVKRWHEQVARLRGGEAPSFDAILGEALSRRLAPPPAPATQAAPAAAVPAPAPPPTPAPPETSPAPTSPSASPLVEEDRRRRELYGIGRTQEIIEP